LQALYLKDADKVVSGAKSLIVTPHTICCEGRFALLCKDGKHVRVEAIVDIGQPYTVDLATFDKLYPRHQVKRTDRMRWWGAQTTFTLHPIEHVYVLDHPQPAELKPGTKLLAGDVPIIAQILASQPKTDSPLTHAHTVGVQLKGTHNHA
jgi:hypothetical protein